MLEFTIKQEKTEAPSPMPLRTRVAFVVLAMLSQAMFGAANAQNGTTTTRDSRTNPSEAPYFFGSETQRPNDPGPFYKIQMELVEQTGSKTKDDGKVLARPTLAVPKGMPAVVSWGGLKEDGKQEEDGPRYAALPPQHTVEVLISDRSATTVTLTATWKESGDLVEMDKSQATWTTKAYRATRRVAIGKKSLVSFEQASKSGTRNLSIHITVDEIPPSQLPKSNRTATTRTRATRSK